MHPPLGLTHAPGLVCHLCHALYNLMQSPHTWYERFHSVALQIGFQPSNRDSAFYIRRVSTRIVLLLL